MTPPDSITFDMHGTHANTTTGGHGWLSRRYLVRMTAVAMAAMGAFAAIVASGDAASATIAVGAGGDKRISVPRGVTIEQGDTVTFAWQDNGHDLSMGGPGGESAVIGEQDEGFRFSRKLDRPGTYALVCQEHDEDGMRATFTVQPKQGGPDPKTLPPPARDVVLGGEGGSVDPSRVAITTGASVYFHFNTSGNLTFSDGQTSGAQSRGTSWSRPFTQAGTYTFTNGGSRGTVVVSDPVPLGIREVPAGTTPNATIQVGSGNSYTPAAVTIDEGGVVQWNWAGGPHNVQFEDGTGAPFKTTGSYSAKFFTPSATPYTFVCTAHPGMSGTVTVRDTGAAGPNETPDPIVEQPGDGGGNPDEGDPGTTPAAADVTVGGTGDVFAPASVSVQTGQSVKWNWAGGVHNVTFEDGVASTTKNAGTFTRRFFNPGTYAYSCTLHPGMTGTVVATGEPVADDGTGSTDEGGGATDAGGSDDTGDGGTDDSTATGNDRSSLGAASATAAATSSGTANAAAPDTAAPAATAPRLRLTRGRAGRKLAITLSEDAKLTVTMVALGRSNDLVRKRTFRLTGKQGANALRLPVMNLSAKRYRLRIVAVDAAGNKSAAQTLIVRVA